MEEAYRLFREQVSKFVTRNSGTADDARECLNDVMLVLYHSAVAGELYSLECKLSTWVYSVTRNIWLKKLRQKKKLAEVPLIETEDAHIAVLLPDEQEDTVEEYLTAMLAALSELGEKCRDMLFSVYFDKHSMEQLASEFGINNARTAANLVYRCRQRLKKNVIELIGSNV